MHMPLARPPHSSSHPPPLLGRQATEREPNTPQVKQSLVQASVLLKILTQLVILNRSSRHGVPGVALDLVLLLLERVLDTPEVVAVVLLTLVLDILDVVLLHDGVEALGPTNS